MYTSSNVRTGNVLEGGFFILQDIVQGGDAVATAWVVESEEGMRVGGGGEGRKKNKK
jgi:hypothetical protein